MINDRRHRQQTASTAFVNLPEVETTGFELEGNWNPIDALNIGFTYAYLNAEITESGIYVDPTRDARCHSAATPCRTRVTCRRDVHDIRSIRRARRSVEGNTLSQSPKHKVAINASYRFDMEDGSYFLPTVSYSWRDEFYDSFFNNDNEISPAYDNLDARLNWKSSDDVLGLTLLGPQPHRRRAEHADVGGQLIPQGRQRPLPDLRLHAAAHVRRRPAGQLLDLDALRRVRLVTPRLRRPLTGPALFVWGRDGQSATRTRRVRFWVPAELV